MGDHDDESDETEGQPMFIPITSIDPAVIGKAIHDAHDRHQMEGEVWRHEVRDLLDNLTPEHAATLLRLLTMIAGAEDPAEPLNFYAGILTAILDFKHNVCAGCGQNHEAEIMTHMQEQITDEGDDR